MKTGVVQQSPLTTVVSPKVQKRLPAFVAEQDMHRLLEDLPFAGDWQGISEQLIINLLYATGIRVSELVNWRQQQFDPSNGQMRVIGKGNKERIIPIHAGLISLLSSYQIEKMKLFPDNLYEQVLLTGKEKPSTARQVYDIVSKTLLQVTTSDQRGPHVLRHSFATHLTNNGAELNAVKELLGHTSLAATQVYTHNSIERLRDIHKKAHPKG
jgi:integrase/recombinase XerC